MKKQSAKRIAAALLALLMTAAFAACRKNPGDPSSDEKTAVRVFALKGPTGMGMTKLMEDAENGTAKNDYTFTLAASPDELTAEIAAGRFDLAAVPANLAAVLYQKTGGTLQTAALNTLGVLYVLENGDSVHSVKDLAGKTVAATGQGSTPEYVLNYLLEKNGLTPGKDVTVEYYTEHAELAALLASGAVDLGMLPQPNVTAAATKNPELRVALDLTAEWDKLDNGSRLTQGCIVVSRAFAENHPEALEAFLEEYRASTEYVNAHVKEAAAMCEARGIIPTAALAEKAIPLCNICCITGEEMKTTLSGFLGVLFEANPKAVGGKLPDENFYY